jgi:hypothetical protein
MRCLGASLAVILMGLTKSVAAQSTDNPNVGRAGNELTGEMLECAVYFNLLSVCIDGQDPKLQKDMENAGEALVGIAIEFGEKFGVTHEGITSSMKLYSERIEESINKNCHNISVAMERYVKFCQGLQQDPKKRFEELLTDNYCNSSYKCN